MPGMLSRVMNALRGRPDMVAAELVPSTSSALASMVNALQSSPEDPGRISGGRVDWIAYGRGKDPEECISTGPIITDDVALAISAVWACIDVIALSLSSSDWNVCGGVRGANDQKLLPEDNLQYILNTRMNPEMSAQSGKRALMIAANGWGSGYAEIVRDLAGRTVELWPLRPDRCQLMRRQDDGSLFLRVFNDWNGQTVDLEMRDVYQVRGPGISGIAGDNQFMRAVKTLSLSVALDQFAASYFGNGTQMGVIMEVPGLGRMDQESYDRMKGSFEQRHRGARNAFRLGFAEGGTKIHQLDVQAEKAQLTDQRYQMIEEIARYWHVPLHKIGHLLRATNNNIEHMGLEFTRDTLRPWKKEIEQEADFKLIPSRTKKFIEIDLDWAAEGDFKSRADAIQVLRGCGVYSVNDALRKLGENTISKAEGGDDRTMNGASVKLQDVGKNMLPAPADTAANDPQGPDAATKTAAAWLRSAFARAKKRFDRRMEEGGDRKDAKEKARKDAADYLEFEFDEMFVDSPIALRELAADLGRQVLDQISPQDAADRFMHARREAQ